MTPDPLDAIRAVCARLKFAPLPELVDVEELHRRPSPSAQSHSVTSLTADGWLPVLFDKLRTEHGPGHRLPAATNFLRVTLREPIFLVASSLYLTGRAPLLTPDTLRLPWDTAEARFRTPIVVDARTVVLPDDPAAEHPDTVVARDEDEQLRLTAEGLYATFAPLIESLQAHSRAGTRTLWGWVLDTLHFYMLNPARYLGRDAEQAWALASRLGDAMIDAGALTRRRPRLFPFAPEDPRGTWAVRGTCCFDYKGDPEHGYCTTCPLKCDSERQEALSEWLRDPALAP
ncbi:(2Fe-2S)-binding protein [Nocardiopsis sp. MG754419]|uniref:(2Fe-2S)-binding protein n=1 Tax=Nocardiopsis sp. MG754419 TaxID=2259865 RepID=UPI001BA80872|nr:(2Fe-2S)-binding protein [Nocardiopsis sp. MG754419]MBR8742128.1 ferric iron reductase FhuF-like transporter family protein [Nocardiopsis sp. MG754419]